MRNGTQKFYDAFYFLYPLVDVFLLSQKKKLSEEINRLPEGDLLEIGVGNGSILPLYQRHRIKGIDISAQMLEKARKRTSTVPISLAVMNGEKLAFENQTFDYVVINHVLAVADNPSAMVSEAHRVLKENGRLFVMNHFTPNHALRFVDYAFQPFSGLLKFKSVFRPSDIASLRHFRFIKSVPVGFMGYFQLIVYSK